MRLLYAHVFIAGLLLFSEATLGHGTESHAEESQAIEQPTDAAPAVNISSDNQPDEAPQSPVNDNSNETQESANQTDKAQSQAKKSVMTAKPGPASRLGKAIEDFKLDDFPTLHPMVVHVPVIMIPLAFLFGLTSIFFANRYFVVLATAFAAAGVLGGYVAAFPMHPHTRGLSEEAARTLQQHDFFAYSTLGITAFSVVVGVIALLKSNFLNRGLLAVALLLASLSVSVTAHYGGTLTYVHGVGVNGNYLDAHQGK